jgi:predicted transport protein
MPAFQIIGTNLKKVSQKEFKDEAELHKLIDKNLQEIFKIRYIKDEYITKKHGRIETLGLDENNRPVVIEYKKIKEDGQLSQANRYMIWIKQNPDSFELIATKNLGNNIGAIDFDNPRIICFAQEYSMDDRCLALSLGAELWKYKVYENNMLMIIREEEPEQLIKGTKGKTIITKVERQPQSPKTIEEHLNGASQELKSTFQELDSMILDINSDIERCLTKDLIIYNTSLNFAYLAVQKRKNCVRCQIRTDNDKINDPKGLTREIPKKFGYGYITREIFVNPEDIKANKYSLDDIIELIKQSYKCTQ